MTTPALFDLSGRVALVTGGAGGLGQSIAAGLAECGAAVAVTSRHPDKLAAGVAALQGAGTVTGVACDVRDEDSVAAAFDAVTAAFGRVDVLVANAGVAWVEAAETTGRAAWDRVLGTNVLGSFHCAARFGRDAIAAGGGGSIVLISSIAGQRANAVLPTAAYAASKAALGGLARQLAVEWAVHGINVNTLALGFYTGGMSDVALDRHTDELLSRIPMGRFGGPDDLKGVVAFLASPASRYITGQVIAADGGQSAW
jgi:NAD(P)-dependent dehydrogenase (short-subunit alcohol dehydrogenase family)